MKVAVVGKLPGRRQVLKLDERMHMSPQSNNMFKIQTFHGDKPADVKKKKKKCWPKVSLG